MRSRLPTLLAMLALLASAAGCSRLARTQTVQKERSDRVVAPQPSQSAPARAGGAGPAGDVRDGRASEQSARRAPAPPPPGKAPQSAPPVAGLYRYAQTGQYVIGAATFPAEEHGSTRVLPATVAGAGAQRQRHDITMGSSYERSDVYVFRADAVLLEESTVTLGSEEVRCRTDHPLRLILLPLTAGETWSDEGRCEDIEVSFTAEVGASARRTVGGRAVEVHPVRYHLVVRSGEYIQTTDATAWISPVWRLVVRSEEQSTTGSGETAITQTLIRDLVSLTPAT